MQKKNENCSASKICSLAVRNVESVRLVLGRSVSQTKNSILLTENRRNRKNSIGIDAMAPW